MKNTVAERQSRTADREMRGPLSGRMRDPLTGDVSRLDEGCRLIGTLRLIEKRHGAEAMPDDPHWSLLKLNAQKQNGYMSLLQEHAPGIESYYPKYEKLTRPHGSRRPVRVGCPVFPGYIFLRLGDQDMHVAVSLPVRATWVKFGGKVESIPGFVISRLRALESAGELVKEVKYVNPYYPGAAVRVHLEVEDIAAVIVKLVRGNRVIVDTKMCRVTVPIHRLRVI